MHKSKVTAFIIKLKQSYRSGWIPFDAKNSIGISNKLYGKLFHHAIELKLLRKGKRGYFISRFTTCLNTLFGDTAKYVRIYNKSGDYKETVQVVLISLVHHKISQQYASARKVIHEQRGTCKGYLVKEYLKEGILAQVRISSRQISKVIDVSIPKANQLIHQLKKLDLIKFMFPPTNILTNDYYIKCNNEIKKWKCERQVYEIKRIKGDEINALRIM